MIGDMDERFYTPKQVADILQVHQYTILKWIREGKIRALKLGRVYRTTESELRAFLGQTAHDSAQEIMRSAAYTPDSSMVQTSASRELPPHVSEPAEPTYQTNSTSANQPQESYVTSTPYEPQAQDAYRIPTDEPIYSIRLEP